MNQILTRANILTSFATDAYKAGHYLQLPPHSEKARFYIAPRKPLRPDAPYYITFGIRYFIERYLMRAITHADIEHTQKIWNSFNVNGSPYPFPKKGFQKIVDQYQGFLPISIVGVKEGQVLDQYNIPLYIIRVNDSDLVWLPGFIETALQRSIWYASTVATISYNVKQRLQRAFIKSVDPQNYSELELKLHDFGARGASSGESAGLGGLAHLLNFKGTDNMEAVLLGHQLYNVPIPELACSIPASEHSTVTSWGPSSSDEKTALLNMIHTCKEYNHPVFAFVSDSYNFYHMVDHIWGDPEIISSIREAKLSPIVRPDSGDPTEVVLYALKSLAKTWGHIINDKGYKVLKDIRIIQGDGMSIDRIQHLIDAVLEEGFSIENIAFGMGGGLLQKLDRDSMSWAMKMHKIQVNDEWRNVRKTPTTQSDKDSFNPQNVVDEKDWVTHYKWDGTQNQPIVLKDSFAEIRKRSMNFIGTTS